MFSHHSHRSTASCRQQTLWFEKRLQDRQLTATVVSGVQMCDMFEEQINECRRITLTTLNTASSPASMVIGSDKNVLSS